jgi:hypothetical protein
MESQPAFFSPNGKSTTIITMMTEVNEHHDSGFIENDANNQQDDGNDAHPDG